MQAVQAVQAVQGRVVTPLELWMMCFTSPRSPSESLGQRLSTLGILRETRPIEIGRLVERTTLVKDVWDTRTLRQRWVVHQDPILLVDGWGLHVCMDRVTTQRPRKPVRGSAPPLPPPSGLQVARWAQGRAVRPSTMIGYLTKDAGIRLQSQERALPVRAGYL